MAVHCLESGCVGMHSILCGHCLLIFQLLGLCSPLFLSDLCFLLCSLISGQEEQVKRRPKRAEWFEEKGREIVS